MHQRDYFKNTSEKEIEQKIREERFNPIRITDESGYVYHEHQHPETKLLVFLKGSMKVTVGGKTFDCQPGDKLLIPGNTLHSAIVGKYGCSFFWSEKLLQ